MWRYIWNEDMGLSYPSYQATGDGATIQYNILLASPFSPISNMDEVLIFGGPHMDHHLHVEAASSPDFSMSSHLAERRILVYNTANKSKTQRITSRKTEMQSMSLWVMRIEKIIAD